MIVNSESLSGIYTSFSKIFTESMTNAESFASTVAMLVPSSAKLEDYKWLGDFPMMREWIGDRVINSLSGFHYEIVNKNFESTISVDRNDIEDDQIGIYKPMIQNMGLMAKQHPDIIVFQLLKNGFTTTCFDGQYFFDADHAVAGESVSNITSGAGTPWFLMDLSRPIKPIILQIRKKPEFVAMYSPQDNDVFMRREIKYGVDDRKNVGFGLWQLAHASKADLTSANYKAARSDMMSLKNDEGTPLGIKPTHLVVPPSLEEEGRKVVEVVNDANGAGNPWYQSVKLLVVPWLA